MASQHSTLALVHYSFPIAIPRTSPRRSALNVHALIFNVYRLKTNHDLADLMPQIHSHAGPYEESFPLSYSHVGPQAFHNSRRYSRATASTHSR